MAEKNVARPWTDHEGHFSLRLSVLRLFFFLDLLLKEAVAKHSEHDNWKTIALCISGRSNKACRKVFFFSNLLAKKLDALPSVGYTPLPPM